MALLTVQDTLFDGALERLEAVLLETASRER